MSDWFNKADYKVDGVWYSVPGLARWAAENLTVTHVAIDEMMAKLEASDRLFVKVDEGSEWKSRCEEVDLRFPVLLLARGDRWDLIDGNHRSWKAWHMGLVTVLAYVFELLPPPTDLARTLRRFYGWFDSNRGCFSGLASRG